MLAVANMEETIAFYQRVLGFTPAMTSPDYSIVERDGQTPWHRVPGLRRAANEGSFRGLIDSRTLRFHPGTLEGCV